MKKVITKVMEEFTCDVCHEEDTEECSRKTAKVILSDGTVLHDADVCEMCREEGEFEYCELCDALVHNNFIIHDPLDGGDAPYCPDCADHLLKELEDTKIRLALLRNELFSQLKE